MLLGDETKRLGDNKELAEESEFLEGKTFSTVPGGLPGGLPRVFLCYCEMFSIALGILG